MKRGDYAMCKPFNWKEAGKVKIMAVADGYAMVRRPRCMPFAVCLKDLHLVEPE